MVKIDPGDLVTVAQAAEMRGVTRQAINHLVRQGKLKGVDIAGVRFLLRSEVESFQPDSGGRPKENKGGPK
ncbi:MAG TPA: helix-turn-helix domain-containing protein [Pyrinomonadaceae bacterium]